MSRAVPLVDLRLRRRVDPRQLQRLEAQHRFKDAEKLYLLVKEPDLAINMYKKNRQYDQMVRLVTTYRKDLLTETHLHLAQQLEHEGNFREAESHYVAAKDWKPAVNMYRANDMWDDAIRVAKLHGGASASSATRAPRAGLEGGTNQRLERRGRSRRRRREGRGWWWGRG